NHDPRPPDGLGGEGVPHLELGGITFRHLAGGSGAREVVGHLHPKARVAGARRSVRRPCFAADDMTLLLPAFGSYAGRLNVPDPAIAGLFPNGFDAFVLGETRVFRVPHTSLKPEPEAPAWIV